MGGFLTRYRRRGLHGAKHINRQRLIAQIMIGTALVRVAVWLSLMGLYGAHVTFARHLFISVSFVALLSVLALALTDWGQAAASMAQLTAGDAHHDAESARLEVAVDFGDLEQDLIRLARLNPGPDAERLAATIGARLHPGVPSR